MPATWISRGTVLIQLGRHHFAFFRGYLNGLDVRQLAERYIETDHAAPSGATDLKTARSLVSWIEEQLMVAARRSGNGSAARVLRMTPQKLGAARAANAPALEEFRAERDPHQMFSESELLELFEAEFGGLAADDARRARRNARLRARQIDALTQLEALVSAAPCLQDKVDGWLDPAIAMRLIDANIRTLNELVGVIDAYGFRWYTRVPRIGIKAARHIVDWLTLPETAEALGVSLSIRGVRPRKEISPSAVPPAPRRQDIVPIEQFELPPGLNAAFDHEQGKSCLIAARDDVEAIMTWLAHREPGSHTARAYRKEAERFLLWSALEAGKSMGSLTVEDCVSYQEFLRTLGRETEEAWAQRFRIRQDRWLGPRGIDRFSSRWRPFERPLSASSQKTALVIVQGMTKWLLGQNYLNNNPFKGMSCVSSSPVGPQVSKALTIADWQYVADYLDRMIRDDRHYRLRAILALTRGAGCRLSELISLKRCDLTLVVLSEAHATRWEIRLCERGNGWRVVHLDPQVAAEIESHFRRRGYSSMVAAPEQAPLISAIPSGMLSEEIESPISASRAYAVIKSFFAQVAASASQQDAKLAEKLLNVSPHCLRDTFTAQCKKRSRTGEP